MNGNIFLDGLYRIVNATKDIKDKAKAYLLDIIGPISGGSTTETDPIYSAWDKSTGITITESQISDLGTYLTTETDPNSVHVTGDQSVAGIKTFSSFPITPSSAPTTDYQVANKKYVDDNAGGRFFNKLDATTAPTVNDDSVDGFEIGSLWIDITHDLIYQATDVTVGAAVWKCLSSVITDDAPSDGKIYGRKDRNWALIITGALSSLFSLSITDDQQIKPTMALTQITWT